MDPNESKPPRRIRYKGTHPKSFKEKYKELQPDRYKEDIDKVLEKGRTPAGMHRSICVNEILNFLNITPGQIGLDATLGYGGHSLEILKCLSPGGRLYAIDVDPIELPRTKERLASLGFGDEVLVIKKMNFSEIEQIAAEAGPLNFVLADLGVSSMQIDNPERGFSLKMDGPLDLRLNPKSGRPASALLKNISQQQLEDILIQNADEPHAAIIAKSIIAKMAKTKGIETTSQLKEVITEALVFLPNNNKIDQIKKSCQRCFQALRIEVNNEFGVLEDFLEKLPFALAPGGRVAINFLQCLILAGVSQFSLFIPVKIVVLKNHSKVYFAWEFILKLQLIRYFHPLRKYTIIRARDLQNCAGPLKHK